MRCVNDGARKVDKCSGACVDGLGITWKWGRTLGSEFDHPNLVTRLLDSLQDLEPGSESGINGTKCSPRVVLICGATDSRLPRLTGSGGGSRTVDGKVFVVAHSEADVGSVAPVTKAPQRTPMPRSSRIVVTDGGGVDRTLTARIPATTK